MRIAIVDDLAAERTLLKGRLEWQLQRRNVQADILEYESGEIFLEAARKAPFTAAYGNYLKAFSHNVKVVSGSTGWMKDHKEDVEKLCADGKQTLFWASNFSI